MNPAYELHLAAHVASASLIEAFQRFGFVQNRFINHRRVVTEAWRGTLHRNDLPDDGLWESIEQTLRADKDFGGTVEEEAIYRDDKKILTGDGTELPRSLPPFRFELCGPDEYKACDLHISISLSDSDERVIEFLDSLEIPSVDRPPDGTKRIYTATCETQEDGRRLFRAFRHELSRIAGVHGKIVAEMTTRHIRIPIDAPILPLVRQEHVNDWLEDSGLMQVSDTRNNG